MKFRHGPHGSLDATQRVPRGYSRGTVVSEPVVAGRSCLHHFERLAATHLTATILSVAMRIPIAHIRAA